MRSHKGVRVHFAIAARNGAGTACDPFKHRLRDPRTRKTQEIGAVTCGRCRRTRFYEVERDRAETCEGDCELPKGHVGACSSGLVDGSHPTHSEQGRSDG